MMANQWFRLYAEIANDPKIQMMSEAHQRRYIMLLCIRCNGDVTLQDEEVAFQLRISNEDWSSTKALFLSKNLIGADNKPTAWDKRQFASDSSAARVAKHRENKKKECNVTVTPQNRTDTDTDTDTEEKKKTTRVPRFDAQAHLVSIGIPQDLAIDWLKQRKTLKAEATKSAIDGIEREAAKANMPLEAALRECCARGWRGFKADWLLEKQIQPRASPGFQSIHERRAETIAGLTGRNHEPANNATERDITGEAVRVA